MDRGLLSASQPPSTTLGSDECRHPLVHVRPAFSSIRRAAMSEVHDRAELSMLLADFAITDQLGKLHVVGGGLQLVNRDPQTGQTAAFALVVTMTFPAEVYQEQYVFEVVLEDDAGNPVQLPTGVVRFAQNLTVDEPTLSRAGVPRRALPAQTSIVLFFNTGLPLPAQQSLVWRARLDGESRPGWTLPFFVPGPRPAPVIG